VPPSFLHKPYVLEGVVLDGVNANTLRSGEVVDLHLVILVCLDGRCVTDDADEVSGDEERCEGDDEEKRMNKLMGTIHAVILPAFFPAFLEHLPRYLAINEGRKARKVHQGKVT
jgi:hypothetical protein